MTSTINEDGSVAAITLLSTSPCVITQIKNKEIDGYKSIQIGFEKSKSTKSMAGHFKKSKSSPKIVREIRTDEIDEEFEVGDMISLENFEIGDVIKVTGTSKGKGWAGTIKRHNFHRGRKTHGGRSYRRPGSIGSMYPQHILKGKKMAGQMGGAKTTVKNIKISLIDTEHNVIGVSGAVPGPKKSVVIIRGTK